LCAELTISIGIIYSCSNLIETFRWGIQVGHSVGAFSWVYAPILNQMMEFLFVCYLM